MIFNVGTIYFLVVFVCAPGHIYGTITLPAALSNEILSLTKQAKTETVGFSTGRPIDPEFASSGSTSTTTIVEGDIVKSTTPPDSSSDVVADRTYLWPNNTIPYRIDARFSPVQRRLVMIALEAFQRETCLRFSEIKENITDDENYTKPYAYIRRVTIGCNSQIGFNNEPRQLVNFAPDCFSQLGRLLHELMHLVGFFHTQNRPDRDDYITIVWDKIPKGFRMNFDKLTKTDIDTQNLPYDYGSLMHYPPTAFGEPEGSITIIAKKPLPPDVKMGQRSYFSELDVKKMNVLYKCAKQQQQQQQLKNDDKNNISPQKTVPATKPTCPAAKNAAKGELWWPCNTIKCIRPSWLCDGQQDCPDGEDELPENCRRGSETQQQQQPARHCDEQQFDCDGGAAPRRDGVQCISLRRMCDGTRDCQNGRDENVQQCSSSVQQKPAYLVEKLPNPKPFLANSPATGFYFPTGGNLPQPTPVGASVINLASAQQLKPQLLSPPPQQTQWFSPPPPPPQQFGGGAAGQGFSPTQFVSSFSQSNGFSSTSSSSGSNGGSFGIGALVPAFGFQNQGAWNNSNQKKIRRRSLLQHRSSSNNVGKWRAFREGLCRQ